jgi:hypothetical protein
MRKRSIPGSRKTSVQQHILTKYQRSERFHAIPQRPRQPTAHAAAGEMMELFMLIRFPLHAAPTRAWMRVLLEADDGDVIRQLAVKSDHLLTLYRHKQTDTVAVVH